MLGQRRSRIRRSVGWATVGFNWIGTCGQFSGIAFTRIWPPISAWKPSYKWHTEFGSQAQKTAPLPAYLIARIRPFVSIKYLLWASDSVSKADQSGLIGTKTAVIC